MRAAGSTIKTPIGLMCSPSGSSGKCPAASAYKCCLHASWSGVTGGFILHQWCDPAGRGLQQPGHAGTLVVNSASCKCACAPFKVLQLPGLCSSNAGSTTALSGFLCAFRLLCQRFGPWLCAHQGPHQVIVHCCHRLTIPTPVNTDWWLVQRAPCAVLRRDGGSWAPQQLPAAMLLLTACTSVRPTASPLNIAMHCPCSAWAPDGGLMCLASAAQFAP